MLFNVLTTALAIAGSVTAVPTFANEARQAATLNAAIVAKGRSYIGTSLTIRNDNTEQNLIKGSEFGSITPENAMKWDATEPNRGQFSFGNADQIANFATQNKKQMRCHTLVWYSQLPNWVNQINNNATLMQVMTNHINTVMGRYKGKCTHWDVVNEALNEDGTLRDNVFLRVIGEQYLPISFRLAQAADPAAKLYYNDYNLEYGEAKHQGALRIVKLVQSWGVKIDGVGLQGHLVTEKTGTQSTPTPSEAVLTKVLQDYADLNVDVAYTELDIRMNTPSNAQKLQVQAEAYARVAKSCINVERCVGITLWGVSDKYSWVPQTFSGEGDALLWNNNFQKKPAYTAFLNALSGKRHY
ncbi:glycoside hydrolase family 10 protein [Aaosphaeria arxii CBS 175.79]|uniref:Beta-xylanase n=1 Tax=Aaosphaeria arxii CBS 175.79 TaxID=1450172 RepID=A0A6A5XR82_9PLEO|nr:glycoside hydrolase family 10 protein [Aaosphaeria arxii CBS 175.79]KAF2015788.1 glycoside hydrolase family 10 protein [Aaosphaeria arxii CBS 175.79]